MQSGNAVCGEMKERPILFSGAMVQAILDGRKTQTRRVVKPQPMVEIFPFLGRDKKPTGAYAFVDYERVISRHVECPYGEPGDRLWVRESMERVNGGHWVYSTDDCSVMVDRENETAMLVWAHHKEQGYCPSIHMPRWASRITLEITEVRVQRVNEISAEDALAEGMESCTPYDQYRALWDSINAKREGGKYAWNANPWVWALTFTRVA